MTAVTGTEIKNAFNSTRTRSRQVKMADIPPGMKSRNPGTKKMALETPAKDSFISSNRQCGLHESIQQHVEL